MERWENRYANGRGGNGRGTGNGKIERIKFIAIILLAVAFTGVSIAYAQAVGFRSEARELMISRAITECSEAVGHVNSMSRSGGSDTAGALGRIRANINAVDVLSGISQSLYGSELAPRASFNQLYSIIDSYSSKLRNGTTTIEELTNLTDGLTSLQTLLTSLK